MFMVNANYFYVYYDGLADQYGWDIREDDIDHYNMALNGYNYRELVCGALVEVRHIEVLKKLLEKYENTAEWITAIDIFSHFV